MQASFFAHRALMRDTQLLNNIANRIDSFSKEQISDLRRWYEFYWNMMERHHQAEDDIMFFELEKRMNQPSEIIEGMEVEHNRLQFLIDEIRRLIGEGERDTASLPKLKPQLVKYTAELLLLFTNHISKEEKYIYESMTSHFTPKEQRRIEARVKRKAPMNYLSYMIPWLHESLSPKENEVLDQSLPWFVKVMNRWFWEEKYHRMTSPVRSMI